MLVGKKIKHLRIIHDLSQKELANLLGVKPSTISKYENNKRNISLQMIKKISEVLHCDLNYFDENTDQNSYTFVTKNISETTLYKFIALNEVEKTNNK